MDVCGEPMKERVAVWGPMSVVKRSLELGCTNVIMSNENKGVDTSMNTNNLANSSTSTARRKIAPPTAEEVRRMIAAGGFKIPQWSTNQSSF